MALDCAMSEDNLLNKYLKIMSLKRKSFIQEVKKRKLGYKYERRNT